MSTEPLSVLFPATRGMDMRIDMASYRPSQAGSFVQWAKNMRIHRGAWRTRYPVREKALDASDSFHERDWQGALIYHPQKGQGVHYFGVGQDRIIGCYGGRLYEILTDGTVNEVVGQAYETGQTRVPVNLEQAENYVLKTDGNSLTLIYDGKEGISFSPGFNRTFPEGSAVPNSAGPLRYLGNRLWVSAYGRRLYAGDLLHQIEPEEAIDVLRFRDQAFDATSQWFAAEATQGDTVAISSMQLGGREYVVMHGDNLGMTGVLLGVPRAEWGSQPMTLSISNETAAAGPYAYAEGDWRLLFRSRRGIEETRLVLAEDNAVGGTAINMGRQVSPILEADIEEYLIFSSLVNPPRWERTLVTCGPTIKDDRTYHRGILSMNRNPGDAIEAGQWAWEGVWTFPEKIGRVQQILEGRIDAKQRVFFLTSKPEGNGLAEISQVDGLDTLADGTQIRQHGEIRLHKFVLGSEYRDMALKEAAFLIRDIASDIDVRLWIRDSESMEWRVEREFHIDYDDCCKCCGTSERPERMVPIGKLTSIHDKARWVQFHLETWGVATWDFAIEPGADGSLPGVADDDNLCVENPVPDPSGIFTYVEL